MTCDLNPHFKTAICAASGASAMEIVERIEELWSGYGQILRIRLQGTSPSTVIAKHVRIPTTESHPRGWNSTEDLDAAGYPARFTSLTPPQLETCLDWLAHFHATFMTAQPEGLWEIGTYWHLATRKEELDALDDLPLKNAASAIDRILTSARYQTIVHGDAKLANFCFSESGDKVAAVDFQYVGGGCGMKDLAYFIGSCLDESACEQREDEILDHYFATLRTALASKQPAIDPAAVESEWRALFPIAWTDFHRFLKGWSPGHWKINSYSENVARQVVANL